MELLARVAQETTMSALTSNPVVHFYDPAVHRIACGVPGFDRSTKHVRAVSCPACVHLLHESAADRSAGAAARMAAAADAAAHVP
jgi:hypothetical protein